MPKNIVIFSDGTGQAGGLKPDQNLSNIYKVFRAARTGPESTINPADQLAFYDPGLGTESDQGRIPFEPIQKFRKLWSGATGTGISRNIADCYEAILKHYETGDRVFLFGFSRGAYTARCVGGVMGLCGIPTQGADGGSLPRHGKALRRIADEAVQQVYEHGSGSDDPKRKEERQEKARRFRAKYRSGNAEGLANVVPYFIGVFDTVAALGAPGLRGPLMLLGVVSFGGVLTSVAAWLLSLLPWFSFLMVFKTLATCIGVIGVLGYLQLHLKTLRDFPTQGRFSWHIAAWRFRFYDNALNTRVRYARHALAIDETRKDFARVPWASIGDMPNRDGEPEWLKQVWFAGNHSDIGGSYGENESRLSDISLQWMLDEARSLPHPLQVDGTKLNLFPDAMGLQHCEVQSMKELYPQWVPSRWRRVWAEESRAVPIEAPLHPTVTTRLATVDGVLHFGLRRPYRPANLKEHVFASSWYAEGVGTASSLGDVAPSRNRQA